MTTPQGASGPGGAAHNSDLRLRRLLDQLSEVVFETDAQGHATFVNAAWTRSTGFDAEAVLGKDIGQFVAEEERDLHEARWRQVLDGRRATCQHEVRFRTAEGELRWMALHAHAESDANGRVIGLA